MTDLFRKHPHHPSAADDDPPVASGIHADPTEVPIHLEELFADGWFPFGLPMSITPFHPKNMDGTDANFIKENPSRNV